MTDAGHGPPEMARLLLLGWRWFDDRLRARLAEAGFGDITTAQSMLFPFLDEQGTRPAVLAERLGTSRQAIHQLVAGLKEQGLVELVPDPTSGRSRLIRLTDHGRRSVSVALTSLAALEAELADRIGGDDVGDLRILLGRAFRPHGD